MQKFSFSPGAVKVERVINCHHPTIVFSPRVTSTCISLLHPPDTLAAAWDLRCMPVAHRPAASPLLPAGLGSLRDRAAEHQPPCGVFLRSPMRVFYGFLRGLPQGRHAPGQWHSTVQCITVLFTDRANWYI